MTTRRRVYSYKRQLIESSREAALAAIQVYNNPLSKFKTENFIVLMIIAWTYMLHAYFRMKGVDYRYFRKTNGRKVFDRVDGGFKVWDMNRCLNDASCPLDANTVNNLKFLIGLRNQIEHAKANELDSYLSGRYQACVMNYNFYLTDLFGDKFGLASYLNFSIQFSQLSAQQASSLAEAEAKIPVAVRSYIAEFDKALSEEEFNSPRYSYRVLFSRKLAGKRGQADRVIEFLDPSSELAPEVSKEYWVSKETEKPKFRAKDVVAKVRGAGFASFGMYQHTQIWKANDGKNPAKGFGVEVTGYWCWYERWIEWLLDYLAKTAPESKATA